MDLEGARFHEVVLVFLIPYVLGPCVAFGTVGAAFAEGISRRRSVFGMLLGGLGATLPWVTWRLLCCGLR